MLLPRNLKVLLYIYIYKLNTKPSKTLFVIPILWNKSGQNHTKSEGISSNSASSPLFSAAYTNILDQLWFWLGLGCLIFNFIFIALK